MTRMQRGCAPFMSSSRAQSSGTSPNPAARAAVAGNIEWMSSVAVNSTEITFAWSTPLRATIAASKAWVRWVTCSIVSSSTVVAPRRARMRSLGAGTPTLSASGPGEELEGIVR